MIAVFAGINFAFALIGFLIAFRNRKARSYLFFSVVSLFSGLYLMTELPLFNASISRDWLAILFAAIYYSSFGWFVFYFVEIKNRFLVWLSTAIFVLAFVLFLLHSNSNLWQYAAHFGLLLLVAQAFLASRELKRVNRGTHKEFTFLTFIFALLSLDEILSFHFNVPIISQFFKGFLPLDAFPVLFSVVIGKRLSIDVLERSTFKIKMLEAEVEKQKTKLEEEKRKKLELELAYKKQDLTDFGIEISKNRAFLLQVQKTLSEAKEQSTSAELQKVNSLIQSYISNNQSSAILQENVKQVNYEFIQILKTQYPELSKSEVQLCLLLRLQLSSKEIAAIKNISVDSMKVLRNRLRKKLHLDSGQNLIDFMQGLQ